MAWVSGLSPGKLPTARLKTLLFGVLKCGSQSWVKQHQPLVRVLLSDETKWYFLCGSLAVTCPLLQTHGFTPEGWSEETFEPSKDPTSSPHSSHGTVVATQR